MKRALLIALVYFLFLCVSAYPAGMIQGVMLGSNACTPSSDSCTGGLTFSWHCETANVTTGGACGGSHNVNNGCSAGATTATANGGATLSSTQAEDGTYSVYVGGGNENYSFSVTDGTEISNTAGTFDIFVYVTSFVSTGGFVDYYASSSDYIDVQMYTNTNNQFRLGYMAAGTGKFAITAISGGFSTGAWYHISAEWSRTAQSGNYLKICADTVANCPIGSFCTNNCGTGTTALTTWTGASGTLYVGDKFGVAGHDYIDVLKIYSTWGGF